MTLRHAFPGVCAAALLLAGGPAFATDAFLEHWRGLALKNPATIEFTVSLSGQKDSWYMGEIVPLRLQLSAKANDTWLAQTGQMIDAPTPYGIPDVLVISPAADVGNRHDPAIGRVMGGPAGQIPIRTDNPYSWGIDLNERIRFLKPGHYRLYVTTWRASRVDGAERSQPRIGVFNRGTPVQVVSNVISLEVREAPAAWLRQQLEQSVATLDSLPSTAYSERRRAARVLNYLDTEEAAVEMAKRLGRTDSQTVHALEDGILTSPHRNAALPVLERQLTDPDAPVTGPCLDTAANLWEDVKSGGRMPPAPEGEEAREAWKAEARRRGEERNRRINEYVDQLAANVDRKRPGVRAICLSTLLDYSIYWTRGSKPQWKQKVSAALVKEFGELPEELQDNSLRNHWDSIRSPELVPALKKTIESATPGGPGYRADLAIRRLYDVAPAEARRVILEQIRSPRQLNLPWQTLAMLPDKSIPEIEEFLKEQFEAGKRIDERVILRYASPSMLPLAKQVYEKKRAEADERGVPVCLSPLIYYFLREDPDYGEREAQRILADKRPSGRDCRDMGSGFRQLERYAMSPALEKLAIDHLSDPSVPIKDGAANILGRFGSPAAEKPLWDTMEYFHKWWKGRERELDVRQNMESFQFERTLVSALAQADGWVLGEPGLQRLRALCSTDQCRREVDWSISLARAPAAISIGFNPGEPFAARVAQYRTTSLDQFRRKLAQFPKGTSFRVVTQLSEALYPELAQTRREVETAVRTLEYTLVPADAAAK